MTRKGGRDGSREGVVNHSQGRSGSEVFRLTETPGSSRRRKSVFLERRSCPLADETDSWDVKGVRTVRLGTQNGTETKRSSKTCSGFPRDI